jgi:hypothetical protein
MGKLIRQTGFKAAAGELQLLPGGDGSLIGAGFGTGSNGADKPVVTGKHICAGYRSSFVVIFVIQLEDTQYHYCPIWRDQISSLEFSYLHHQLLFNTTAPQRRRLKAALLGVKLF